MLIAIDTKTNSLDEVENLIESSIEVSDSESSNSTNFVPLIATESGNNAIDISDILDFCEKENMSVKTAIREICEYNNIDNISFYVSESNYIESDELRNITNLLQESGEEVYKVPISNNNPIYICANKAIDELAYNDNSSLLESFMEDDYTPFSDSIYESIINEAKGGHGKRGGNIDKAHKLTGKVPTATTANDGDEQQQPQAPNTTQPQQNNQSEQQNGANTNTKPNSNNNNQSQPQTQNSAQQQKQPNTNNSTQPTSNNNQPQPNSNNQPQQSDDQQEEQKEKQQETQVENVVNNMEKSAENKPAGFISSKIAALRKLYQDWLAKKNQEKDQGKIGFFSNILRAITNCIDRLLAKLQGVKKAESDATNNSSAQQSNGNTQTVANPATANG